MAKKSRLLELLKKDLEDRRSEHDVLGVKVFVSPMSMDEQITINAMHPADSALQMAEMLVRKCCDENGQPVFTKEDKPDLKRAVAGDRLSPLLAAINGRSVQDQVKN